jgi:uncharacterized protein YidB (DUF937 family)
MSLIDALKKQVADVLAGKGGPEAEAATIHPGVFAGVVDLLQKKGLAALVEELKAKGLSNVVASWVGKGENLPISADQLRAALGPEAIETIAQKAGLPPGEATALLAKILPGLVDKLTPEGNVPAETGSTPS